MDFRIFIEPQQGTSYDDVLALAQATERLGFDAFFTSDHYLRMGDISGLPGPLDAWMTLAGLARDTTRLRLGTLVSPITFRLPGRLAIATVVGNALFSFVTGVSIASAATFSRIAYPEMKRLKS